MRIRIEAERVKDLAFNSLLMDELVMERDRKSFSGVFMDNAGNMLVEFLPPQDLSTT